MGRRRRRTALHQAKSAPRLAGPGSGRFYVDLDVWMSLRRARRRVATALLLLVVVLGVVVGILPSLR